MTMVQVLQVEATGVEAVLQWLFSPSVRLGVAITAGIFLLWTLYQRVFLSEADPSIGYTMESDAGTASILLSGVKVTMLLSAVIVAMTWPLILNSMPLVVALALANMVHWIIERREVDVA